MTTHIAAETFESIDGVSKKTIKALNQSGIVSPFPVQQKVLPHALAGRDVLVQSPTGSGKTLAFGIPIVEKIAAGANLPTALILVPTRELAMQVCDDLRAIAASKYVKVAAVYGGASANKQLKEAKGAAIVVATPGRLADNMRSHEINLSRLQMVVLDEADRMLDMGFQPQVDEILSGIRGEQHVMLFSATLEGRVAKLAKTYTRDAVTISTPAAPNSRASIDLSFRFADKSSKLDVLLDALNEDREHAVVFARTKRGAESLSKEIASYGVKVTAIHGDMTQPQRTRQYRRFQSGECDVLVATDVFARGMDIDMITHVINFDLPEDGDTFKHRIGRTGRAGRDGRATTIIRKRDIPAMKDMLKQAGFDPSLVDTNAVEIGGGVKRVDRKQEINPAVDDRGAAAVATKPAVQIKSTIAKKKKITANDLVKGHGTVVAVDMRKRFGFIKTHKSDDQVFFHQKSLGSLKIQQVRKGAEVSFVAMMTPKGLRAESVTLGRATTNKKSLKGIADTVKKRLKKGEAPKASPKPAAKPSAKPAAKKPAGKGRPAQQGGRPPAAAKGSRPKPKGKNPGAQRRKPSK